MSPSHSPRHASVVPAQHVSSRQAPLSTAPVAERHTGYAPTDHGESAAHESGTERHSGYCPTDFEGVQASRSHTGGPGGMAATGSHSQGGGHVGDGLRHSGWGPTDGAVNSRSTAAAGDSNDVVHDV